MLFKKLAISSLILGLSVSCLQAQQILSFDKTRLDALLQTARTTSPPKPVSPTVEPVVLIPVAPLVPGPVPDRENAPIAVGRFTCDMRLDALEAQTNEIAQDLVQLEQRMSGIRPKVREVMLMLQQPTSNAYCASGAIRNIEDTMASLQALPLENLRDLAKENMLCGGSKTEEMRGLKDKATQDQDDTKILRLIRLEDRLLRTDQQAILLAENTEALFREGQRFLTGMQTANDLCTQSIDF